MWMMIMCLSYTILYLISMFTATYVKRQFPHLCPSINKYTLNREHSTEIPHAPISPARHTTLHL